jgi:hypothetical protein
LLFQRWWLGLLLVRRVARWRWCFVGMVRVCSSFCFPRLDGRRGSGWPDDWLVFK